MKRLLPCEKCAFRKDCPARQGDLELLICRQISAPKGDHYVHPALPRQFEKILEIQRN